jgi:hypothetical protein
MEGGEEKKEKRKIKDEPISRCISFRVSCVGVDRKMQGMGW